MLRLDFGHIAHFSAITHSVFQWRIVHIWYFVDFSGFNVVAMSKRYTYAITNNVCGGSERKPTGNYENYRPKCNIACLLLFVNVGKWNEKKIVCDLNWLKGVKLSNAFKPIYLKSINVVLKNWFQTPKFNQCFSRNRCVRVERWNQLSWYDDKMHQYLKCGNFSFYTRLINRWGKK